MRVVACALDVANHDRQRNMLDDRVEEDLGAAQLRFGEFCLRDVVDNCQARAVSVVGKRA